MKRISLNQTSSYILQKLGSFVDLRAQSLRVSSFSYLGHQCLCICNNLLRLRLLINSEIA